MFDTNDLELRKAIEDYIYCIVNYDKIYQDFIENKSNENDDLDILEKVSSYDYLRTKVVDSSLGFKSGENLQEEVFKAFKKENPRIKISKKLNKLGQPVNGREDIFTLKEKIRIAKRIKELTSELGYKNPVKSSQINFITFPVKSYYSDANDSKIFVPTLDMYAGQKARREIKYDVHDRSYKNLVIQKHTLRTDTKKYTIEDVAAEIEEIRFMLASIGYTEVLNKVYFPNILYTDEDCLNAVGRCNLLDYGKNNEKTAYTISISHLLLKNGRSDSVHSTLVHEMIHSLSDCVDHDETWVKVGKDICDNYLIEDITVKYGDIEFLTFIEEYEENKKKAKEEKKKRRQEKKNSKNKPELEDKDQKKCG